ncbi:MAG TPA: biopolymer transporter ExbD [Candidatus Aquilonibacter sp.]|nr:biopolymer transporter ExbD [Candidatus Aquilonibacter sp.]
MGMTVGGNKEIAAEPNIVPLIDVLLVLIIIFMVITTNSTGLPALVPQPAPPRTSAEPQTIVIRVMPGGKLLINQDPSDWDTLGARLSEIFKDRADKVAFVKGDTDVRFDQVARAIDIMRGAGIEHVGLITARD